jgi:hypothetical protein
MCDLTAQRHTDPTKIPTGLAFEISDLIFAGCWAAVHDFKMQVRLDHGVTDEDYEEVVEFRKGSRSGCRSIMWRDAKAVFLQPIMGRKTEHASVEAALAALLLSQGQRK